MGLLWTILIGFVAGLIARAIYPGGRYEPSGFILTALLGIVGAVVMTFIGRTLGWYGPGDSAGLIGAIFGAILVLAVWVGLRRRG